MTSPFAELEPSTLLDALQRRLERDPDAPALVMVKPGEPDATFSVGELVARAALVAKRLQAAPAPPGRRVVKVCLYHGIDLHAAFVGAMLAGYLPSMIAPPSPRMEKRKYSSSFVRMLEHVRPAFVLTNAAVLAALADDQPDALDGQNLLDVGEVVSGQVEEAAPTFPSADPDAVALLQHSSGTTGLQKGVTLSHRAVLAQVRSYAAAIDLQREDVIASWLPLYHDMGFIACFVMPLVTGVKVVELSPFDWVSRPALLLEVIERHRATLCWLPNFAYVFMAKSVRRGQPDVSSIRAFVNCSEPVMAASHRAFVERFETARANQLTACYAMAENVFAVTQSCVGQAPHVDRIDRRVFESEHRAVPASGDAVALELVSNGAAVQGVEVQVVASDGQRCPERHVGEIWVRGACLFSGYYLREDLTTEAFDGDWYKTGDLGYLAAGELYVTGREKDLIVIQGRNFYPSDLEAEVGAIDGVVDGRVAAFGDTDAKSGTEALVIVAETLLDDGPARATLQLAIRKQVAQAFDCTVSRVHLVDRKWLVKSTAGKVARADNRLKYERLLKP